MVGCTEPARVAPLGPLGGEKDPHLLQPSAPQTAGARLGANEYHPTRLQSVVLEVFLEQFELIYTQNLGIDSDHEPEHFIIARRKLQHA